MEISENESCMSDKEKIENFVTSQAIRRGLDERTVRAYELDLQHLYRWLKEQQTAALKETTAEEYLKYLIHEKKLKPSTVIRKYRVLQYYLEYLFRQGLLKEHYVIPSPVVKEQEKKKDHVLSKKEIDAFFAALDREYESLDNAFRRRVCLRDKVMMELLFFHGIEVSELLRLEVSDYNSKTGLLAIKEKRGTQRFEYLFSKELKEKLQLWIDDHEYFEKENGYDGFLFLSKTGKPLSMKMVILIFDKYRILAGIEDEYTPKDLKNSMKKYARELLVERCS